MISTLNVYVLWPNPFCIDEEYQLDYQKKEKMILYVGRINTRQKRFQSLL